MKIETMNRTRLQIAAMCIIWALGMGVANAQHYSRATHEAMGLEEAMRLLADGHYEAARQSVGSLPETLGEERRIAATEIGLTADYYLHTPGTKERIERFVAQHKQSLAADRLSLLRANIMVSEGNYTEALYVYDKYADAIRTMHDAEREETNICKVIALINNEDIDRAEELLGHMQNCTTHQMDMVYYTGYVKYLRGRYAEALEDFQILNQNSDYSRTIPVYMADCYLNTQQPSKALSLLNNQLPLVSLQQADIDMSYLHEMQRIRGEAYYDQKNYTKAIEPLGQYVYGVETPKRTALYKLGLAYMGTQEYAKAAPLLSRSADIYTDEMAQSSWLNAGICYVYSQNKRQAQIAFQQASEMTASTALQEEALYNYALTLHEGNTMGFGESVNVFERFLNQFPQSAYASSVSKHLSEVYFTTKNYPAALASINKIKNPSREILNAKQRVLYNLGVQEFIAGKYPETDAYMNQAIDLGSNEAYYIKGESEYRQGKLQQAMTDLHRYINNAQRTQNNYGQAIYTLAYAYFKQKKYNQALTYFNTFTTTRAASADSKLKADALNRLADCQYVNRQYDEAYATYQRAINTNRQMGDYALYQQAFIEGLRGNYEHKVELLSQMTDTYADSPYGADALFEQGRAYIQTGAKQQALQTFATLMSRYPHSQMARSAGNEVGLIYFEAGNTEAALEAYNKVINSYPNTEEAQTALANLKDIYTDMGRVNEYASLAQKAGKSLSSEELDQMISDAAVRSMQNGEYAQAQKYYQQLSQQTTQADIQMTALEGTLRSSFEAKDYAATAQAATQILQNQKASPNLIGEALIYRAESYIAQGRAAEGVKDLQTLSEDQRTSYGAQANVRLAQYAFDTNQYTAAEQLLNKFIDSGTTHQYWLARAFILLADVYNKTNRAVEAREYLLSLKSNYNENKEINQMINERLK